MGRRTFFNLPVKTSIPFLALACALAVPATAQDAPRASSVSLGLGGRSAVGLVTRTVVVHRFA